MDSKPTQQDVLGVVTQHEQIARDFGFVWDNIDQILEQIQSECLEVKHAWLRGDQKNLEEEIGDLINATISLAIFCDLNPTETLAKNNKKFHKRYQTVVSLVQSDGLDDLKGQPLSVLLNYWQKAKEMCLS